MFKQSISLSLLCLASWLYLVSPAQAQMNSSDSANYQNNEYDAMGDSTGFNPMDFIHKANFNNHRNPEDFNSDTQENLDDAAAEFKRQQQMQLQNQPETGSPETMNQ